MNVLSAAPRGAILISRTLALAIPLMAASLPQAAENPFADIVRKTEPLTPEQEQKAFHLPPGFEIELVASEPDIGKPINMAFDAQGRLWITQSREYPFPAPEGKKPRDAVKILTGVVGGGRAKTITTFADGLNIPIGIYPYRDGAIGYSIPYIYFFEDTNGDGVADKKEPFLGRFGYERDTHGMTSSFRRGFDGWLYANHGYNNTSTLTAKDGSSIQMTSGNTYRVKIDGSHIEQFAWGRVNPFGLMFDPLGNIYSSDCETMPIYQILRGAYYPSFGRPHDGLGFAPAMMNHKHGSTAIAGLVYYAATNFPLEFRDNIFVGNVMTCRIDRDSLVYHGSSPEAKEEPDFLATDDPWFRPVDLQLGPDGAMYVADFYNRIIGHYEVPLDHPGRDRERGRIWRITYHAPGASPGKSTASEFNLAKASVAGLIQELGNPNITIRMLAMNELTDRIGASAIQPVTKMLRDRKSAVFQRIHGLWVLYRLGGLDPQFLAAAARDPDRALRVHAMRIFSELNSFTPEQHSIVLAGLHDPDPLVERTAADALGRHPQWENLRPLLDARHRVPAEDTHFVHVIRMALRDQLRSPEIFSHVPLPDWSERDEKAIADVCPGLPTTESAKFLLKHLQKYNESRETSVEYLRHAARYLPDSEIGALADFTRTKFGDDLDFQFALFKSVREGMAQRGASTMESLRGWAADVAARLAAGGDEKSQPWFNTPVEGKANVTNPWFLQERASADGDKTAKFLCSLPPGGEQLTGILRSQPFAVPARLSFFLAGHDGYPNKPPQKKNVVRLRAADTREVLAEAFPPRNDMAQPVSWDLSAHAGRQGYLEIVDGDDGKAYAWLAVGRFKPEVVKLPIVDPRFIGQRKQEVAELARSFKLTSLEEPLTGWLADKDADPDVRAGAARAVMTLNPEAHVALVGRICADASEPAALRQKVAETLGEVNSPATRTALIESLCAAPERLQVKMALALAGSADGAEALLQLTETGKASPRLLLERSIKERLTAVKPERYVERVEKLTKGLAPLNQELQKVIDQRRVAFDPAKTSAALGAKVFTKNCTVCHSMDNQGGAVGPHLDGVGNRGLERLLEDVLDPNRIVDPGFRYSIVSLKNGEVVTGLLRREEGQVLVFADATGKEISVPKKDIESRVESQSSLMPDNFSELIPVEDFNNLMAFLLSKGSQSTAKR